MRTYALVAAALVVCATPLGAQGKGPKKYAVSNDRALIVTKEVLVKQGYEVVRVENSGRDYVVWYRRALPLATSPVAPTIPDDVVAAAVLHPYHLVPLLHQHLLRDDQCTVVRDRVLLRPLPLRPEWRGADDERGDDQSIRAHRPLPISGSASQSCSTACYSSPRRSCRSWRRGRTSQPGTPWCSRSRQTARPRAT